VRLHHWVPDAEGCWKRLHCVDCLWVLYWGPEELVDHLGKKLWHWGNQVWEWLEVGTGVVGFLQQR